MLLTTHIASKRGEAQKADMLLINNKMHLLPKGKRARKEGMRILGMDSDEKFISIWLMKPTIFTITAFVNKHRVISNP